MRKRLTAKGVEALKIPPASKSGKGDGRQFHMDTDVSGFGVKVTERGGRSYVLIKRYPGSRNPTAREIGRCDALSLEEAREKARQWNALLAKHVDPKDVEADAAAVAARKRELTVAAVAEDFFREKLVNERRGKEVERDIRREFIARWAAKPIHEVSDIDVLSVIKTVKGRGATSQARNLLGYASRFFDWAIDQRVYGLKVNPCAGLKPAKLVGEKISRERVLSTDEIAAFWRSTRRMPYPYGPIYRLLLLTGLRLNEVADAKWSEFRDGLWTVPAERMKGRAGRAKPHIVPITDDIYAVLKSLPILTGPYVFSTTFGKSPVWVSAKVKMRLDRRMRLALRAAARNDGEDFRAVELVPFVNHDLRRTVRTQLSALRVDRDVREAVLAHTLKGVEGVYDRHDYLDEKRDALERWSAELWRITAPPAAGNVVRLARA